MQELALVIFYPTQSIAAVWNERQLRGAHGFLEMRRITCVVQNELIAFLIPL
jgi:hypothetical protein